MQLRWVGDARDYVKWDCVYREATTNTFVYYVPMLRDTGWSLHVHPAVQQFFNAQKDLKHFHGCCLIDLSASSKIIQSEVQIFTLRLFYAEYLRLDDQGRC